MRDGIKLPRPPSPEPDPTDKLAYLDKIQQSIERKSTAIYAKRHGTKEAEALDDIINDYSRQTSAGVKSVIDHINRLRFVAMDIHAHEKLPAKKMKTAMLEKYIDYTVATGMVDQDKTDLNYSPEGKIRRDWLNHLDKKEREGQQFILNSVTNGNNHQKENRQPAVRSRNSQASKSG